eukprot:357179-Chlamydomonas_euryale.AAC.2
MERGLVAAPGTLTTCCAAVAAVEKIRFFAGDVRSGTKMHINIGHTTVMAEVAAFGVPDGEVRWGQRGQTFVWRKERAKQGGCGEGHMAGVWLVP